MHLPGRKNHAIPLFIHSRHRVTSTGAALLQRLDVCWLGMQSGITTGDTVRYRTDRIGAGRASSVHYPAKVALSHLIALKSHDSPLPIPADS